MAGGICPTCGLPLELCMCEEIAREQQQIRIYSVKRRYGKVVTIVEGIDSGNIDVDDLARQYANSWILEKQGQSQKPATPSRFVSAMMKTY